MPIRTASLRKQIQKNGAKLHLATAARVRTHGAEHDVSEQEQALLAERRELKAAQSERIAAANAPKAKAAPVVRTPKAPKLPKAPKTPKEPKEAKQRSAKPSRAEKLTKKAANLEAAKKATKKSAKT